MEILLDIVSFVLMTTGGALVVIGTIGLIRLPDVYCRMHATGITDTLAAMLFFLGLMIQAGFTLVTVKLLLILIFLVLTTPASTYAVANAAYDRGLVPILRKKPGEEFVEEPGRESGEDKPS